MSGSYMGSKFLKWLEDKGLRTFIKNWPANCDRLQR